MATGSSRVGNILLGNCIGKGAFGSVWRGLNLDTATTVAVKQINLSDIPSAELANIMMEIDLLKNLNHPNIVKYFGFEKSPQYLNIILELCENGSLRSLCKNFGKLPEHLGAMYITQVLEGLIYLHDQGVIHRDIKGANILATKDGLVKLADFGVATLTNDVGDVSVAGTPYWMAPEIIELSGATTASDIWSVGCTVIELLDGEPPYHDLPPMGALYRIVQDDHPPIPESVSAIVRDFLMQCFQKDCNLRVSAKKLSKHPWIQMSKKKVTGSQRSREKAIPAYDEAVKSVQQWNEALKGTSSSSGRNSGNLRRLANEKGRSSIPAMADIFPSPRAQNREPAISAMDLHQQQQRGRGIANPAPLLVPQFNIPAVSNNNAVNLNNNPNTNTNNPSFWHEDSKDNWDDDFSDSITSIQLAALEFRDQDDEISKTIRPGPRPLQLRPPRPDSSMEEEEDEDGFEDEDEDLRLKINVKAIEIKRKQKNAKQESAPAPVSGSLASRTKTTPSHVPVDLVRSRSAPGQLALSPPISTDEFQPYRENDEDDFSDLFDDDENQGQMYQDEGLTLQTRLSNHSWFGNDAGSDEEDPFAEVDEGFDEIDLEANIAREKYARTCASFAEQFRLLEEQKTDKQLEAVCDRLIVLLSENPDMRGPIVANHGVIPLLDVIENRTQPTLILKLLTVLNMVIRNDFALQESLCLVGAIPVLTRYTAKRYGREIQLAAASFIQQICHTSSSTLQMFISCRGLRVLIDFLQGNYSTQKELVWIAINGIHSVFNLQSLTPRNDFCRLLAKQGLLDPLSSTLYNTIRDPAGASYTEKIVQVLLIFSQGDSPVKELLATRQIVHRMLNSLQSLPVNLCVMMLKCIKNISMNSNTLDVLQNASAIHTLVQVLGERTGQFATDVCNHVLTTLFNLCRINKSRQEEAAQAGIIPHLQYIAESTSPLKQFALPILCDLAHAGRACRNILWNNDCLPVYLRLFKDPYWQVNAMDAVLVWLQDETADVEQVLIQQSSLNLFVQAFLTAKANSFENILEPFYKILRISPQIARGIAVPALFQRLLDRLAHPKAVVRLNLLRILRAIFDVHPERIQLVDGYGMSQVVVKISEEDPAVLVKELAKEILDAFEESDSEAAMSGQEDEDNYIVGVAGRGAETNGFNSFASAGDFFGLLQSNMYVNMLNTSSPSAGHLSAASGSAEQSLQSGVVSSLEIHGDVGKCSAKDKVNGRPSPQHATSAKTSLSPLKGSQDFLQNHVDDLDIKSGPEAGTVFLASSRRKEWNRSPTGSSSLEIPSASVATAAANIVASQQRTRRYSSDSNQSSESDGLDDHFVTSRGWIGDEGDHPEDVKVEVSDPTQEPQLHKAPGPVLEQVQSSHIKITESQSRPSSSSIAVSRRRRFGHQKSKSLGEILELNLDEDIAKSQQVLEGVQLDQLSDSMILRSEMPKIRLELLDIDHFPAWNRRELEANYEDDEEEDEQNPQANRQQDRTRGGLFRERNDSWGGIAEEPESIGGNSTGAITTSINSSHWQLASVRRATIEGSSIRFSSPIPPPFDPQEQERPSAGEIRMARVSEPSSSSTLSSTSESSVSTSATSPHSTITTSFIQRSNRDFGTSSSWDGAYTTCKESRGEESSATSSSGAVPSQMRAGSMATAAAVAVSPTTTTTTKIPGFMQGLFDNAAIPTSATNSSKPRLDRRSSKSEDGYGYDYGYLRQHLQQQRHSQLSPTLLSPTAFSPTQQSFKADSDLWDFQTRDIERNDSEELEDDDEEEDEEEEKEELEDGEEEEDGESEEEEDWDKEFQLDVQPTVRLSLNGPSKTIAHPLDHGNDNDAYAGHDNYNDHDMDDSEQEEEEEGGEDEEEDVEDEERDESEEDEESEEQDDEELEVADINWEEEERKVPTTPTTPLMPPSSRATASTPLLPSSSSYGKDSE